MQLTRDLFAIAKFLFSDCHRQYVVQSLYCFFSKCDRLRHDMRSREQDGESRDDGEHGEKN